jgi:hypothetical protein
MPVLGFNVRMERVLILVKYTNPVTSSSRVADSKQEISEKSKSGTDEDENDDGEGEAQATVNTPPGKKEKKEQKREMHFRF